MNANSHSRVAKFPPNPPFALPQVVVFFLWFPQPQHIPIKLIGITLSCVPVRRGRKGNFSWRSDVLVVFSNGHKVKLIRGDRVRPATTQDIDGRYQGPSEFAPVSCCWVVRRVSVITRPASWPDAPSPMPPSRRVH
ncbi:hypothetical protein PAPYR_1148 [Paratrimastix pyriformis]|uniref:Uncharacterized protein n=1 Tax=Paratrimastix pyriformis TaxID=342808 RepID=A0ABQ8UWK8_9EUKA|nr:hypothetical protein PAPYR_1148 [Paratrimastix pyriformis]